MTHRHQKRSNYFQSGTPYGVNSRPEQGEFSVNFNKVFESWSKLRDLLSPTSNIEAERLKNVLPSLFKVNQDGLVIKDNKRKSSTNKKPKVCYVDLNKLEKTGCFSVEEKKNLRNILSHLKYSDIEDNIVNKTRKKKNTKTAKAKKIKKTVSKEKPSTRNIKLKKAKSKTRNRDTQKKRNPKKGINSVECLECKRCSEMLLEKSRPNPKNRKRNKPISMTMSQERILHALIELDPRACGDSVALGFKSSSRTINTILKENQNINIKNIELKYLNPTYVVQYNTTEPTPATKRSQRAYSFAALDAHLGQTACPNVRYKKPSEVTAMHYDPSEPHIVGMGPVTEKMLRESQALERTSLLRKPDEQHCSHHGRVAWTPEPIPLFLLPQDEQTTVKSVETPKKKKKESKCNIFAEFIRKYLCLSWGKESNTTFVKVEINSRKIDKKDIKRLKKNPKLKSIGDLSITRTTREEFIQTRQDNTTECLK